MAYLISEFIEPIRVLTADDDPEQQDVDDGRITAAVRATVKLRPSLQLTVASDIGSLSESPTADQFALVCLITARTLIGRNPEGYAWRTRAAEEKTGSHRVHLADIDQQIDSIENGVGRFATAQSFGQWIRGQSGLSLFDTATRVTGGAPMVDVALPQAVGTVSL